MDMTPNNVRIEKPGRYTELVFELDGITARLDADSLIPSSRAVYLGPAFESKLEYVLPEKESRAEMRLKGVTDDKKIVDLFLRFYKLVEEEAIIIPDGAVVPLPKTGGSL